MLRLRCRERERDSRMSEAVGRLLPARAPALAPGFGFGGKGGPTGLDRFTWCWLRLTTGTCDSRCPSVSSWISSCAART